MSAPETHAIEAITSQLATAVEQYGHDMAKMLATWPDVERHRRVSAQIETIRMYSSALPELHVQWVEFLLTHSEVMQFLWRSDYGPHAAPQSKLRELKDRHADAMVALRNRCARVTRTRSRPEAASPALQRG